MVATIKMIAKHAGVSPATVSYVLNNTRYVSPELTERVLAAVKELNYVPNAVARGLRIKASKTIGLVLPDITNPFFPELAKGCEDVAYAAGYNVIMMSTDYKKDKFESAVLQIREGKVDGLILANTLLDDQPIIEQLIKEDYPIVLAHRRLPGLKVDTVRAKDFEGAFDATNHLIKQGHQKIGFITGVEGSSIIVDRFQGFKKAMNAAGLAITSEWMRAGNDNYQVSYDETKKMLNTPKDKRPTAILIHSDVIAMGVLDAVSDLGIEVPKELALISFDDLVFTANRSIQLTTVRIPRYEIGQLAAEMLLRRLDGNGPEHREEVLLSPKLIVRRTCGYTKWEEKQSTLKL